MNLLLVLFLAACTGGSSGDQAEGPAKADKAKGKKRPAAPKGEPINVKGVLDYQDEGAAVLKPCGGGEALTLRPGSGDPARVRSELGEGIDDVYVEMRGLKQDDGSVIVKAFDVAMVGFDGCAKPLDVTITAFGSEPAWKADIQGENLTIEAPDVKETTYTGLTKQAEPRMPITFEATAKDGSKATFALKRERCKDLKNNAFFPWAVTVDVAGKSFRGCARGDLPKPATAAAPAEPAGAPEGEAPAEE